MEVRVAVISNVDSGKSTLVATLAYDILDDGRGSARKRVLYFPHEQETGRTSSVTKTYKHINTDKYVSFIDLAGHEKYLKTTLHGITGYDIDYAILVVGANMGVSLMTKEHLSIVTSLKIPVIVVITKIDIAPKNILDETIESVQKLLEKTRRYQFMTLINNSDQVNQVINLYEQKEFIISPIFMVSNKTGENLQLLKELIHNLPLKKPEFVQSININRKIFRVQDRFYVKGVGIVISGQMMEGEVHKGDELFLGPLSGGWIKTTVKSLHNNFREEIQTLQASQAGCLALNFHDKKIKMNKSKIRKGIIVADQEYPLTRKFRAKIMVTTGHATTIKIGYQPVINCKTIVQAVKLTQLEKEVLRGGEITNAEFVFIHSSEYVNVDDIFIFREGNLRGLGKITELLGNTISGEENSRLLKSTKRIHRPKPTINTNSNTNTNTNTNNTISTESNSTMTSSNPKPHLHSHNNPKKPIQKGKIPL